MIAETTTLFRDHRAVELVMSSPDPSIHERIGRGVRNFASAVWDREKQNNVISRTMKRHLLSTGNQGLGEASLLEPVGGYWSPEG